MAELNAIPIPPRASNNHANEIRAGGIERGVSERTSFSRGRDYVYPVYVTREPDMSIRSLRRVEGERRNGREVDSKIENHCGS